MSKDGCRWCIENGLLPDQPVASNGTHYVVPKQHPTTPGALVIPRRHVEAPFELTPQEWADFGEMLGASRQYLAAQNPDGFTLGWNVGAAAGQHIFHAHLHVLCRFDDDSKAGKGLRDFIVR